MTACQRGKSERKARKKRGNSDAVSRLWLLHQKKTKKKESDRVQGDGKSGKNGNEGLRKNKRETWKIKWREQPAESERNILAGWWDDEMGMVMFLFMPTNAVVPASPLLLLLSRRNPIHKQDLKTGDGDWFPERCVSVCTSLCVCMCVKEKEGKMEQEGGRW